ncbi:hypothetical protein FHX63_000903 [Cupriavidus plantarum]|uniref:Uncharacterized protein n=1 Tax=Cupriavidus plantarum TaxID=942865 RepID=A0A316F3S5_9BURK|nr:hypothetical protein [Cupriavidus plantarum]PWK38243.1 hypothetical protein C7419_1012136 [Cupriavidus plantarum]
MICNRLQPSSLGIGTMATMNGCLTQPAVCKMYASTGCASRTCALLVLPFAEPDES